MKKERIRKPDGRYLIYYRFDEAEVSPAKGRAKARRKATKRRAKGRGR